MFVMRRGSAEVTVASAEVRLIFGNYGCGEHCPLDARKHWSKYPVSGVRAGLDRETVMYGSTNISWVCLVGQGRMPGYFLGTWINP